MNKDETKGYCATDTSLVYAAGKGKVACVKELIAAGADVNAACECHGNGPLESATLGGHVPCVKELLAAGVDVDRNSQEWEYMFDACNKWR